MNVLILNKQRGLTLVELIITISVVGILSSIALPSFGKLMQKNKMTSLHNELLSSLSLTRNIAISRGSFATLCKSNQVGNNCDSSASWEDGWIVFPDRNNNGVVDVGEDIIAMNNALPEQIAISFTRNRITYGAQGYARGYSGIFTFCDNRGEVEKQGMVISNNGNIRVATSSNDLDGCSN